MTKRVAVLEAAVYNDHYRQITIARNVDEPDLQTVNGVYFVDEAKLQAVQFVGAVVKAKLRAGDVAVGQADKIELYAGYVRGFTQQRALHTFEFVGLGKYQIQLHAFDGSGSGTDTKVNTRNHLRIVRYGEGLVAPKGQFQNAGFTRKNRGGAQEGSQQYC